MVSSSNRFQVSGHNIKDGNEMFLFDERFCSSRFLGMFSVRFLACLCNQFWGVRLQNKTPLGKVPTHSSFFNKIRFVACFKHVYSKAHTFKHPTWKMCFSVGILLFFIHSQEMREHHASSCYCCLPNHCRRFSPICIFNCIIMERCQKWHFILKDFVYNSYRHTWVWSG